MAMAPLQMRAALFALLFQVVSAMSARPSRYLIVSEPTTGQVSYMAIRNGGKLGPAQPLIEADGKRHPQGLAIDFKRSRLLVADPDALQILSYHLRTTGAETLVAESAEVLANNTEARWVAADGLGNIFFTDERANKIYRISSGGFLGASGTLYDGATLSALNGPGGIAVDTFNTYWVNKHIGTQIGSVARGSMEPEAADPSLSVSLLTKNTEKSYGICLALNNIFYTQPESIVYGVKKTGGEPVTVSDRLMNPRGCAWDGDGTVFVADRGMGAVYAFASNMQDINAVQLKKVADLKDAFGVAVFAGASICAPAMWSFVAFFASLALW
jgi:sugar lactone lactonase YvrE